MGTKPEAEQKPLRHLAAVLTPAEAGFGVRSLQRKDPGEAFADGNGAQLPRRASGGVKPADQSAHAGSGNSVDGDAVFFKPLKDADVREAEGAATFQGQPHGRTAGRSNGRERGLGLAGSRAANLGGIGCGRKRRRLLGEGW